MDLIKQAEVVVLIKQENPLRALPLIPQSQAIVQVRAHQVVRLQDLIIVKRHQALQVKNRVLCQVKLKVNLAVKWLGSMESQRVQVNRRRLLKRGSDMLGRGIKFYCNDF